MLLIPQVTSVDLPQIGTAAVVKIPCSLIAFHLEYSFHISLIFCLRFFSEVEPAGVCLVYVQSQVESLESQFSSAFYVFLNRLDLKNSSLDCPFFLTCLTIPAPALFFLGSLPHKPPACFRLYFWVNSN